MKVLRLALVATMLNVEAFIACAAGGEIEIGRFQREYPAAAAKWESAFAKIRGTCRLSERAVSGSAKPTTESATFNIDEGFQKVAIGRDVLKDKLNLHVDIIYCLGERKTFSLYRTQDSRSYVVQGIGSNFKDAAAYDQLFGRFLKAPFSVNGLPLTKMMKIATFKIVAAENVIHSNKPAFKLDFEVGDASPNIDTIIFDPERNWAILAGEIRASAASQPILTFDIAYASSNEGLPLPSVVTFSLPGYQKRVCEFDSVAFEPTPVSEFSMEHYGLPDLAGPQAKSSGSKIVWWLAAIGAAGLLLSVAMKLLIARATHVEA